MMTIPDKQKFDDVCSRFDTISN